MDVVYVLGLGSLWQDNEIRFSLRSLEKHLSDVDQVFVVGSLPPFLQNVIHIPAEDQGRCGPERIGRKIIKACRHPDVSQEFLFMNDDFFFTKDKSALDILYYHDGDLSKAIQKKRKNGSYKQALLNTGLALCEKALPTRHFDIHLPIKYDKHKFIDVFSEYSWKVRHGYVLKSLYGNARRLPGWFYEDCKINHPCQSFEELEGLIADRFMFSIGDEAINDILKEYLLKLFPNQSRYERTA